MNLAQIPQLSTLGLILFLVGSWLLPLLSSLVTTNATIAKYPEVRGILTGLLSVLAGVVAEWAQKGDGFNWLGALKAALVSWGIAFLLGHKATWQGSKTERRALNVGSKQKVAA